MKIKSFNEFINESVRDLMKPKTEEEIIKALENISPNKLLMYAVKNNDIERLKIALERGADPTIYNHLPILSTARRGNKEMLKMLLDNDIVKSKLSREELQKYKYYLEKVLKYYENINNFINENYSHTNYLKWKRQNVTVRGVRDSVSTPNNEYGGDMLGKGLYTAFLSNKKMVKEYGKLYYVLNAIPKHPKIFNTLNDWEIWFGNTVVYEFSKQLGKDYPDKRDFYSKTTIEEEMQRKGYDGIIIKGREMVNFTPPDNVLYFSNEQELINYFENNIEIN